MHKLIHKNALKHEKQGLGVFFGGEGAEIFLRWRGDGDVIFWREGGCKYKLKVETRVEKY